MNKLFTSAISRWLPPILLMLIIFIFSSMPSLPKVDDSYLDVLFKKLGHMIGYGMLMITWIRALKWQQKSCNSKIIIYSFLLTFIYAISDEWHQSYVPYRHASLLDVGIDSIGAIIAGVFYCRRNTAPDDSNT